MTPYKLVLFHPMDPRGRKLGGIETHLRLLVAAHPRDFSLLFVGIDEIGDRSIGEVTRIDFEGRGVDFLPVLRADQETVEVGADSNIQDGAVLHADRGFPATIGDRVTVGHAAVVHGATIEDDCIIGMGAVLLNGVHVERGCVIAAGSVLTQGLRIPAGSMAAGSPASVKRDVRPDETHLIAKSWRDYVDLARAHALAG